MKIGFDAKRFFHNTSGLGNYSRDLIYKMLDLYPKEEYFLFNPKKGDGLLLDEDYISKFKEINPNGIIKSIFHSFWRSKGITEEIKKLNLDVYHGLSAELPWGIHKLQNVKKIVTVHDLIFVRYPELYSWFDARKYLKKLKYACNVADVVIATSNQTKQDIIDFAGINESKIEVVYQGCNDFFSQEFNNGYKISIIEKFSLPEKYILHVGTIEERKNLLTILKSLSELPENINLVVIGKKKKYYQKIEDYIDKNNLKNRVWFIENLVASEIAVIYKMAYVFIYPSIFEGFGIPLVEAMFSRVPVITSNVSCLPEIAGKYSFKIDPFDHKDLASKIKLLLNDKNISEEMVNKSYEYVQKTFDKNILTEKIFNLYK